MVGICIVTVVTGKMLFLKTVSATSQVKKLVTCPINPGTKYLFLFFHIFYCLKSSFKVLSFEIFILDA